MKKTLIFTFIFVACLVGYLSTVDAWTVQWNQLNKRVERDETRPARFFMEAGVLRMLTSGSVNVRQESARREGIMWVTDHIRNTCTGSGNAGATPNTICRLEIRRNASFRNKAEWRQTTPTNGGSASGSTVIQNQ